MWNYFPVLLTYVYMCWVALVMSRCDPMDRNLSGSSVHRISQSRIQEWVSMPISRVSFWARDWTCISYIFCIGRQTFFLTTNANWESSLLL